MKKRMQPVRHLDAVDGTIYGKYNKVNMINPYKSHFVVTYSDGVIQKGNNLFDTGWNTVHHGISTLSYILSTGHIIDIPKMKGYLPTIEVSESVEGFKLFHAINVNCIAHDEIITYRIILKEDKLSKYKIGDIVVSRSKRYIESSQWKMSA